jgi:hypothetical protein
LPLLELAYSLAGWFVKLDDAARKNGEMSALVEGKGKKGME